MGDYLKSLQFPNSVIPSKIGTGYQHSGIIDSNGDLFMWGFNLYGQLGIENIVNVGDGPNQMGNYMKKTNIGTGRKVMQLNGGNVHCCVILDTYLMKCFGNGTNGKLGSGDTSTRGNLPGSMGDNLGIVQLGSNKFVQKISLGQQYSCAYLTDQTLKCFGGNLYGQLGTENQVQLGDNGNEMGEYLQAINFGGGIELETCFDYSPTSSPTPYTFSNDLCQSVFSGNHNCVLTTIGKVKCFGNNEKGQLGYGDLNHRGGETIHMGSNLPFVNIESGSSIISITSNLYHVCSVTNNFQVKCWGDNVQGTLGLGDNEDRGDEPNEMGEYLPFVNLGPNSDVIYVKSLYYGNCALINFDSVKCWGDGAFGRLGYGNEADKGESPSQMGTYLEFVKIGTGKTVLSVSGGYDHVCVIVQSEFSIKCWGRNNFGQLGYGDVLDRGDDANEMSDYLGNLDLGSSFGPTSFLAKSAINFHNCAVSTSGITKCFGYNFNGQLGLGDYLNRGDFFNSTSDYLEEVNLGTGRQPVDISLGISHTVRSSFFLELFLL